MPFDSMLRPVLYGWRLRVWVECPVLRSMLRGFAVVPGDAALARVVLIVCLGGVWHVGDMVRTIL